MNSKTLYHRNTHVQHVNSDHNMSPILQGSSKVYTFTLGGESSIVVVVVITAVVVAVVVVVVTSWPMHT